MLDEQSIVLELQKRSLDPATSQRIAAVVTRSGSPQAAWAALIDLLTVEIDFSIHIWLYEEVYQSTLDRPGVVSKRSGY
jgi:hypothetical protein